MTAAAAKKPAPAENRKIEQRWGKKLTAAGWTAIPNVIIQRQKALGLTPLDMNILLQLATYWWEAGKLPFPAKKKIADAIGVLPRTVQKHIAGLEAAKFIARIQHGPGQPNRYDFAGLIKAAQPFAEEELQAIEQRRREHAARLARKKPKLAAVGGKVTDPFADL